MRDSLAGAGEGVAVRRVRLRPNRNCIGLGLLIAAMWYAGASQTNGAAYLLCFLIVGVVAVSALHAWANVCGLRIVCGPIAPVFAGEEMHVPLTVHGTAARGHAGIQIRAPRHATRRSPWSFFLGNDGSPSAVLDEVQPGRPRNVGITVPAPRRGRFDSVTVEVVSLFPIGFLTASARVSVPRVHSVYPKAEGRLPLPRSPVGGRASRHGFHAEGDDFAGVRPYRRGESQRHIDWKAVARGQPMLVKQWAGEARDHVLLDWNDLPRLAPEERLSQLARWLLTAERQGARYSLSLPGITLPARRGEAHLHECLRTLATAPT
jgi:uncharacterized protein (DUF58 family)